MKAMGGIEDCRTCFIEPPESSRGIGAFKSGAIAKLCSKPIVPGCNVEPVNDQKNRR